MKKLTKREKILIYSLGCLVIVLFGLYFVVFPSYARYQAVKDQVSEAQFTQESMAMAIDNISATTQIRDEANRNLDIFKIPYSQKLTNEKLDMLLTQLCMDYSLNPTVLAIESNDMAAVGAFTANMANVESTGGSRTDSTTNTTTSPSTTSPATSPTATSPGTTSSTVTETTTASPSTDSATTTDSTAPNSITASAAATTEESSANPETGVTDATSTETTDSGTSAETTDANTSGPETWTGVVNMEITGTQANFYRLLDAVAARSDMVVSSFAIVPEKATGTTSGTSVQKLDGGYVTINVMFTVYMVKK